MKLLKLTPVLMVDAIEPVLPFWVEKLGFVILERDGIEVMYQTKASVAEDVAPLSQSPMKGTFLFFQVEDLDDIERRLAGVGTVVPRRKTFYGADELIVKAPCGNTVTFAQFASA